MAILFPPAVREEEGYFFKHLMLLKETAGKKSLKVHLKVLVRQIMHTGFHLLKPCRLLDYGHQSYPKLEELAKLALLLQTFHPHHRDRLSDIAGSRSYPFQRDYLHLAAELEILAPFLFLLELA